MTDLESDLCGRQRFTVLYQEVWLVESLGHGECCLGGLGTNGAFSCWLACRYH